MLILLLTFGEWSGPTVSYSLEETEGKRCSTPVFSGAVHSGRADPVMPKRGMLFIGSIVIN